MTSQEKASAIRGAAEALLNYANISNPPEDRIAAWARHFGFVSEHVEDPERSGPHHGSYVEVLRIVDPSTGKARYTPSLQGPPEPMPHAKLAAELVYQDQLAVNARIAAGNRRH